MDPDSCTDPVIAGNGTVLYFLPNAYKRVWCHGISRGFVDLGQDH